MDILSRDRTIISNVLNRLINCRGRRDLYVLGEAGKELKDLYSAIRVVKVGYVEEAKGDIFYSHVMDRDGLERLIPQITKEKAVKDFVIYASAGVEITDEVKKKLGHSNQLNQYSGISGPLFLIGSSFEIPSDFTISDNFKVMAIVHFYNEIDIIERTIQYLLKQEIDLYLVDNWSYDGSFEIAERYQKKFPERIYLERFPAQGRSHDYEWYDQLKRTEVISKMMNYNWFIHYDMDEIRVSPWENTTLRKAIGWIDHQGYNCIENTVIDFRFTKRDAENIFGQDTFFDFRHDELWHDQLKTWKKSEQIDLKSSGGHFARVENPRIYPLKFLNRHYPLRSIQQAEKKVFQDRKPRFQKEQAERGWHGHYENFVREEDFIFKESELLLWEDDTFRKLYIPLFLECGIRWNAKRNPWKIELPKVENQRIIIYGAGSIGREVYPELAGRNQIIAWTDKDYQRLPTIYCEKIESPQIIKDTSFDYIVVTVIRKALVQEIREELECVYGVPSEKILFVNRQVTE